MSEIKKLKVAIVYDRVNKFGGAERVLLVLHEMFPDAPLFTSVYDKKNAKWAKVFPNVYTTFLQSLKFVRNNHQLFGWLMPLAFELLDFDEYNIVITVTSEAAKGIVTTSKTLHICYCLTPTRYLWSGSKFYFNNPPGKLRSIPFYKYISIPLISYLRWWDIVASQRPDKMIAISTEVKNRISKYYKRDSEVIFPPVTLKQYYRKQIDTNKEAYVIVGRFEPYKRLDLVIDVFNEIGKPLIVAGSGSEMNRQKKRAKKNISFVDHPNDSQLSSIYNKAKAFIMPQHEDFGITSVEAQSFGVPVIAFKKGGAVDTVIDKQTGLFFNYQTVKSLKQAIANFDTISFNRNYIKKHAEIFSKERFKRQLQRSLIRTYSSWRRGNSSLA